MDHFQVIYASKAAEYHRMIAVEDVDQNLPAALKKIVSPKGKIVVDLGSGTGRFPLLFHHEVRICVALDLQRAMLLQQKSLQNEESGRWTLIQGDMRQLPFRSASVEIVLAGWAIGHLRSWFEQDWKQQIGWVLQEMHRIALPGASLIICETMSTGSLTPAAPTPELAQFYAWLEDEWGFSSQVIATDYSFNSVEDAVTHTEFFFGSEMAEKIRKNAWARLPEWTGIWSKTLC